MTLKSLCPKLIENLPSLKAYQYPWQAVTDLEKILQRFMTTLPDEYDTRDGIAVHKNARVDSTATLIAPIIVGQGCFVGPHTLLRGGVYIANNASIGPGCEIKHSFIGQKTALAHFNFVGDSVIGGDVNFEAGAITANHYNERVDKMIFALWNGKILKTDVNKFGACIGDGSRLGANAVTTPGTILQPKSVVRRLELIEQIPASDAVLAENESQKSLS